MSCCSMRTRRARPGFVEPCQPTTTPRPPDGPEWLHEIKHDGYRIVARRDAAGIRLITSNGHDWSDRYPAVAQALRELFVTTCMIDGEVVIADADGIPCFDLLRRGSWVKPDAILCAFDLIELNGQDLRRLPIERKFASSVGRSRMSSSVGILQLRKLRDQLSLQNALGRCHLGPTTVCTHQQRSRLGQVKRQAPSTALTPSQPMPCRPAAYAGPPPQRQSVVAP